MPEVVVYLLEGRTLEQKRGRQRHHASRRQECRHDRGPGHCFLGGDSQNGEGQGWRAVQRDAWSLANRGEAFPSRRFLTGGLSLGLRRCGDLSPRPPNIAVIATHNGIAALR